MDALAATLAPPAARPADGGKRQRRGAAPAPQGDRARRSDVCRGLAGLEALLAAIRSGDRDAFADIDAIHADNRALQDHWLAAADHRPPPEHLAARFHAVTHSLSLLHEAACVSAVTPTN